MAQTQGATVDTDLWNSALSHVARHVKSHSYDLWLRPIECTAVDPAGRIRLRAPNRYIREWFEDNYRAPVLDALRAESGRDWQIVFEEAAAPEPPAPVEEAPLHPALNPKYTFDSFVAGPSNQLAHGAARAVAERPGARWNPLFLYGGVGLGKTHLCQAIGQEVHRCAPGTRILYVSSEVFMNEFINGLRSGRTEEFRQRYREGCDLLLIDDIQFLAGRDRTQDEFFHTFNALYDSHRQIVLTSDRVPSEIGQLEDRLRTRFQQGLIADIAPPDVETRIAILHKKAEQECIALPADVALLLAQAIRSNVRELEGALIRIAAHASLTAAQITVDLARATLAAVIRPQAERISVEAVQKAVAAYYNVRVVEMRGQKRDKRISVPRQVAMYLARKLTGASYPDLGQRFGGKDHTTVLSACRKIGRLVQEQASLKQTIESIERSLQSP